MSEYYVYIMTNRSGTLYIGVTNDLERRVLEHKSGEGSGFTKRCKLDRLVYFEETSDVLDAIAREKQLKGWLRRRKVALIAVQNPLWRDLSEGWCDEDPGAWTSQVKNEILCFAQNDTSSSSDGSSSNTVAVRGRQGHV